MHPWFENGIGNESKKDKCIWGLNVDNLWSDGKIRNTRSRVVNSWKNL